VSGLTAERAAALAEVCRREVARGRACGHEMRQHAGASGPCIASHGGGASVCACVGFSAEPVPWAPRGMPPQGAGGSPTHDEDQEGLF
jgi:hypothetical protein